MFTQSPTTDSNKTQTVFCKQDKAKTIKPNSSQAVLDEPGFLLSPQNILQLQRTIGNRAVIQLLRSQIQQQPVGQPVQRTEPDEDELQMKQENIIQRAEIPEEEELQMKRDMFRISTPTLFQPLVQKKNDPIPERRENRTGMPDNLKVGLEALSGFDLSDVRVHDNSNKPSQIGALGYTLGTDIYIAPGQEQCLPHEGWHAVQQKQGRVQATTQAIGLPVNDEPKLENEADVMGEKALQLQNETDIDIVSGNQIQEKVVQKRGNKSARRYSTVDWKGLGVSKDHIMKGEVNESKEPTGLHAYTDGSIPSGVKLLKTVGGVNSVHWIWWTKGAAESVKKAKWSSMFPQNLTEGMVTAVLHKGKEVNGIAILRYNRNW